MATPKQLHDTKKAKQIPPSAEGEEGEEEEEEEEEEKEEEEEG